MHLASLLNQLNVDPSATKGVVELVAQSEEAYDNDMLKPEYAWLEDVKAYIDRGHSDEPFTYYVEHKLQAARWNDSDREWEETSV